MKRFLPLLLLPLLFFAACKKVPDHAKYIPKNALTVVGINLKALSNKMLWNKLTGSSAMAGLDSAFTDMGTNINAKSLEKSGVNTSSTIYAYLPSTPVDPNMGSSATPGMVAIVPLEDAGEWEAFVKKMDGTTTVQKAGENMSATSKEMSVLWSKEVAFVTNNAKSPGQYAMQPDGSEEWQEGAPDAAKAMTLLQGAMAVTKDGSLIQDSRFIDLEKEGNDVSIWVNYEEMMSKMGAAMAMGAQLMKETAIASGLNFEKGELDGTMRYYVSPAMKEATSMMGDGTLPSEMMDKMPKQNLAGFMAMSLSTKGLKSVLEKTGMLGVANMAMASQGLTIDDIFDAFTGDMTMSFNNIAVAEKVSGEGEYAYTSTDPKADFVIAMKLGKKEAVAKIMNFFTSRSLLTQMSPGVYSVPGSDGIGAIAMNETYAVACNTVAQAQAWLAGKGSGSLPEESKGLTNDGPFSMYADGQVLMSGLSPLAKTDKEKAMMEASRKMFRSFAMSGGKFSGGAVNYTGKMLLVNKDENALVQLANYFSRMKAIDKRPNPEVEMPMIEEAMPIDTVAPIEVPSASL
jgi:hypothetical protein